MTIGTFTLHQNQYPDPFLDMASTKLPKSRIKLIELCKIFALTHPQIAPIVSKLAKYPITSITISSPDKNDEKTVEFWRDLLEDKIDIYHATEEFGLDYNGTGNAVYTIIRPFVRLYKCQSCGQAHPAADVDFTIRGNAFVGQCKACKSYTQFEGVDRLLSGTEAIDELSIVMLPIEDVVIKQNRITHKKIFFMEPPNEIKNAVRSGKPDRFLIDTTPWDYVRAAIYGKKIKFDKNVIFHHKSPTISSKDSAYGLPFFLAAVKDAYLNQVYKKADETVAQERTVPARFVFPSATTSDPMQTINLSKFSAYMSRAMKRFRYDKNTILPVPFPIGVSELGGDASRLFTAQLRDSVKSEIIGATGMFEGFLSDGMTWSGGSVQLRMLENSLLSYSRAINKFLKNVVIRISSILGIPPVEVKMKPFRTQDDVQLTQILMSLAQMNQVSFETVLDRLDLKWSKEHEKVRSEVKKNQAIDVEKMMAETKAALATAALQVRAQSDGSSYGDIDKQIGGVHAATVSAFSGDQKDLEESESEAIQGKIQAENQPSPQEELASAQAENLRATSATKTSLVKSESKDGDFIDSVARKLLSLSPSERDKRLEIISEKDEEIYVKVTGRMEQIKNLEDDTGNKNEQGASEEAVKMLKEIRSNSSSPQDLAYKIIMLDPELKAAVFNALGESDPQLAIIVSRIMNSQTFQAKGNGNQVGSAVDMTQMPQAKPPRRK